MSTHCDDLLPLLLKAADDAALGPADRQRLDAHLAGCAACAEALADQRAMRAALGALREAPVTSVGHLVMAQLRQTQATTPEAPTWFDALDWKRWTWRLVPVAAALALAVANVARPAVTAEDTGAADAVSATADVTTTPASAVLFSEDASAQDLLSLLLTASADQAVTTGGGQ